MMRRRRHARLPPASGAAGGDTDALQTDVMRFMSIIGLCLMAVFALVQGIPVQEQEQEKTRKVLADIERASREKEQELTELRRRLVNSQVQLDHSRKEIEALRQRPQPQAAKHIIEKHSPPQAAKPVIEKRSPPAPAVKPVPARQGFSLQFASDAALDRLVAAGSVTLYGMADQQAWQLSLEGGRPAVVRSSFPGWFHEMSVTTVPKHYLYSLKNVADGPGPSGVVWGVQLPATTRTAITSLTRGQQGGALVIRGDGQVTLEE